jgi:hypothetical protein
VLKSNSGSGEGKDEEVGLIWRVLVLRNVIIDAGGLLALHFSIMAQYQLQDYNNIPSLVAALRRSGRLSGVGSRGTLFLGHRYWLGDKNDL